VSAKEVLVFVTAFAPGDKGGIHAYEFDSAAGKLRSAGEPVAQPGPSCIMLLP
jgi:6-phosphogluconolactonase